MLDFELGLYVLVLLLYSRLCKLQVRFKVSYIFEKRILHAHVIHAIHDVPLRPTKNSQMPVHCGCIIIVDKIVEHKTRIIKDRVRAQDRRQLSRGQCFRCLFTY